MPTSLELGLKYTCRKVNRGRHALKMRKNGTRHDILNTNHLGEKGKRKEGGLKEYITEGKKLNPKPTNCGHLAYIHMLVLMPIACSWETVP